MILAYEPAVNALALRLSGLAEYDDLRQEGLIAVWQALDKDILPSSQVIRGRMVDWIRYLQRLDRLQPTSYQIEE